MPWLAPAIFFLLPVAYVPGIMSISVGGRWAVVTVGAALLMFTADVRRSPTTLGAAALLAWMAAGLVWTDYRWDVVGGLVHWVPLLGLLVWASCQIDLRPAWTAYALGVSVSLPFALMQWLGLHPVWDSGHLGFDAVSGLFLTSNVLAEVSCLAVVGSVAIGRWPLAVAPALCALLSGRREAALMLLAAALVWCWTARLRRDTFALAVTAVAVVAVTFWLRYGSASSDAMRLQIWGDTAAGFSLAGRGLNSFASVFPSYPYSHSDPLQLVFELGVGAALAFWLAGRGVRRDAPVAELCLLVAFCASALVWFPLEDPATAVVAVVVAGRLSGARDRAELAESVRREARLRGRNYSGAYAGRALRATDGGRAVVAAGPEHPMGAGGVQAPVQPAGGGSSRRATGGR